MTPPFTHLHVASGYSLQYGAALPAVLVAGAVEHGMDALALTDRDGLYGAVKFVVACRDAGLAPLLGADLAVRPSGLLTGLPSWAVPGRSPSRRTPVRGGAGVDPRDPRVTVLALGADPQVDRAAGEGWAGLCRLVTATHLAGERGRPVSTLDLVAEHAGTGEGSSRRAVLAVLLGPDSEVGRAVLARRPDVARAVLERWRSRLPAGSLAVEVVYHRGPETAPAGRAHAARMLALARECGVPAVLSNAVRYATRDGAMTVDVLDAARRLVVLDTRNLDRSTAEGYLAGSADMAARAAEVARAAGDPDAAAELLAGTVDLALRCRLDPASDLGLGSTHLPEPEVLGLGPETDLDRELRQRCEQQILARYPQAGAAELEQVRTRLEEELGTITTLGIPSYFLTVARVCDLIRDLGVRAAARGSGAGSLVNHLLGISAVDPLRHGLLMERFLTPMRAQLPDVDIDVESARRTEVYRAILDHFGAERVTCVSMMDTYRVRHAVRDVGAALGLPPTETDAIAKAFPHIRARDVRHAIAELPELQASGLAAPRLDLLFDLVERLDGLPRHTALHPCGVVLSDVDLLRRTPVEASWLGFPMSQFDKDDVEAMGLLKLDVLGIRMQSAMSYAVEEVVRVDGPDAGRAGRHAPQAGYLAPDGRIDLDAVPPDDEDTFRLIRSTRTLGCFQIESPGQRELVGKFAPETFHDLIIDISLFRPGPVKSDMVTPFLRARQGWDEPEYLHPRLAHVLQDTCGVVVFHEQVLQIVDVTTGCGLAEADEVRRMMGSPAGQAEVERWFRPGALAHGFEPDDIERIWQVLTAFASFGFCKAHAAAFAVPTYQSAWLKAHHPAAFLAGVLTHDPGMYPKRLILDDARNLGITVLPLDVNSSDGSYRVELLPVDDPLPPGWDVGTSGGAGSSRDRDHPDGRGYGIRLSLAEVKGISEAEVSRLVAARPYHSLNDLWQRAEISRPVAERLIVAGGLDSLYGLGEGPAVRARGGITRRDLLLTLAELDRWGGRPSRRVPGQGRARAATTAVAGGPAAQGAAEPVGRSGLAVRDAAAGQSRAARPVPDGRLQPVQLAFDLAAAAEQTFRSGLEEMTSAERVQAELEVLGLDASRHVLDFYRPLLEALEVTWARQLRQRRNRAELLVAGVKVATQTPPVRSGRRVVFLTLDDSTGPVDATFFEDAQGPYAGTVFHSWLLLVRGVLRRTGPRGVSLRATGAWELPQLWDVWSGSGLAAVHDVLADGWVEALSGAGRADRPGAAGGLSRVAGIGRDDGLVPGLAPDQDWEAATGLPAGDRAVAGRPGGSGDEGAARAGGMGGGRRPRRVLVHPSGFRQSPYADLQAAGDDVRDTRSMLTTEQSGGRPELKRRGDPAPRKLWHSSPGSSGP